jgi:hypothetical protein
LPRSKTTKKSNPENTIIAFDVHVRISIILVNSVGSDLGTLKRAEPGFSFHSPLPDESQLEPRRVQNQLAAVLTQPRNAFFRRRPGTPMRSTV